MTMTAEAIEHYNSLLEGPLADDAIEKLCEGTVRYNLRYGDRPVYRASPRSVPADAEPQVRRSRERSTAGTLADVDVPEFVPRG